MISRPLCAVVLASLLSAAAFAHVRIQPASPGASAVAPSTAPVVDEKAVAILRKYVEATGGKAAYDRITTREIRATLAIAAFKVHGSVHNQAKAPNLLLSKQLLEGQPERVSGYDGKSAWSQVAGGRARILTGEEQKLAVAQSGFNAAANAEKIYSTIRYVGEVTVDGKLADRIELRGDAEALTQSYDRTSGLLVQSEVAVDTRVGEKKLVSSYSDYRLVDGILYPFLIESKAGEMTLEQKITEIKHNTDLPDSIFAPPANAAVSDAKAAPASEKK